VVQIVRQRGLRPVVIRHPMPYGDLAAQRLQRFATFDDLTRHRCTIEEREEYELHLEQGTVVYAGMESLATLGKRRPRTRTIQGALRCKVEKGEG
jgi:predicted GTPase